MEFRYITQIDEAVKSLEAFKEDKYLFIDTEVAVKSFEDIDFFNDKIRLIQIGNYSKIFVYDMFRIPQFSEHLKELLENKGVIGHNLKFDIKFLKTNFGIFPQIVFDTMRTQGKNTPYLHYPTDLQITILINHSRDHHGE